MISQSLTEIPPLPTTLGCWDNETNLPKFIYLRYEGMESDITDYLQSFFFHREWQGSYEPSDIIDANVEARMQAVVQTGRLMSAMEEATVIQLHEAQRSGLLAYLGDGIAEIHSLRELTELALSREFEKSPDAGPIYEYKSQLRVLNALEEMMIKEKGSKPTREQVAKAMRTVIASPKVKSKTRESSKTIEHILQKEDLDDETKLHAVTEIMEDIVNKDISAHELRAKNQKRMGKIGEPVTKTVEGGFYVIGGKDLLVVKSSGSSLTRAIQSQLKGLVEFGVRDPANLLKDISEMLTTKGKYKEYRMKFGDFCMFFERTGGNKLPDPKYMAELMLGEVADKITYLSALVIYRDINIPLYEVTKSDTSPLENTIIAFGYDGEINDEVARLRWNELLAALRTLYPVPATVKDLFPYSNVSVGLYWDVRAPGSPVFICLQITRDRGEVSYESMELPVEAER